ncbi:MAG: hypothetical protein IT374_11635 [Polyangiaceae bacterium]|nr:hypothetical protein [Polyangiaceae bacterium]
MVSLLGATLACAVGGVGCAEEKAPITRVQPNALSKSYFVGANLADTTDDPEFFWRAYVVDNAASASWVTVGTWNHVDRIKWEISEDMLIGRKSYQLLPGSDAHALPGKTDGTVVAAYKITSHFDIRRAYNPQTGEEQNIIEENRDRPWNEREFFRVDWSTNMVQDPMGENWLASMEGALTFTPLTYTVTDPASEDAPHFEPDYFDITNRYYVAPANASIWGIEFPACFLTGIFFGSNTYECDAQESTVRFSFMRTNDAEQDFEPLENTNAALDVVGNPGGIGTSGDVSVVTAGREGFDPAFGYLDKNFHSFANIHNIWKKSHVDVECSAKGDADHNGTDDQCEGASSMTGSQCDVFVKKCTLPYREREVRTVGYWVNREFPADLQDTLDDGGAPIDRGAAEDVIFSWNQLMKASVGYAREVECRRTGEGDRASCHSQYFDGKEMVSFGGWLTDKSIDETPVLTLCHNPVRAYDLPMCGKPGDRARDSDLRKNWLIYWPYASRAPYGGIANWNGDPLTGRIIGGAALTMGSSTTRGAAFARDVLQLAIGDITATDYFDGVPTETYARRLRDGFAAAPLDDAAVQQRVAQNDAVHAANTLGLRPLQGDSVQAKFASFVGIQSRSTFDQTSEAAAFSSLTQRSSAAVGSSIESSLLTPSYLATSVGVRPGTPAGPLAALASPLSLGDVSKKKVLAQLMRNHAERHGMCFLESDQAPISSISLPGLGKYFLNKYPGDAKARGEAIYQELVRETFKGIALHEVGHSLGMLHQFASSWDSMNYEPQYWQLRTSEGQTTGSCNGAVNPSGACMGPRYLDPLTPDEMGRDQESRPGIDYFANTSTMEYQSERFGETAGLGSYDQHTMKALYGRVIEVMDDSVTPVAEQRDFAPRMQTQLNDQDVIMRTSAVAGGAKFAQPIHYTELARAMKRVDPARDCRDATDEEKATAKWRIVHGKVCSHTPKDHAAWQDLRSDAYDGATTAIQWHVDPASKAAPDRVRWFYRWGSTDNSYVHTNPSDAGADIYEAAVFTQQQFDALYPYMYLRSKRREWAFWRLPARVFDTTFERVRTYHWNVAMRSAQFRQSFGAAEFDKIAASDDWHRPYLMANVEAFNLLARAVLAPQPGGYVNTKSRALPGWNKNIYDVPSQPVNGKFTVEAGVGRFVDTEVDNDLETGGGSWDYNEWTKRTGFSEEKGLAIAALVNGRPPVYAPTPDTFIDPRSQHLNFHADMPLGVERLLAGVMSHDWQAVGMSGRSSTDNPVSMIDLLAPTVTRDGGDVAVFPNIGYDQQLLAGIYAMLLAGEGTDMSLTNQMRVWVDGLDGPISTQGIPDLTKQVRFTDPRTGFTYIARKYGSEDPDRPTADRGMAARMLGYANALVANTYVVESDTPDQFGRPVLALDAQGQPQPKNPNVQNAAYRDFVKYVGLIDTVRQLGFWFGQGPL